MVYIKYMEERGLIVRPLTLIDLSSSVGTSYLHHADSHLDQIRRFYHWSWFHV